MPGAWCLICWRNQSEPGGSFLDCRLGSMRRAKLAVGKGEVYFFPSRRSSVLPLCPFFTSSVFFRFCTLLVTSLKNKSPLARLMQPQVFSSAGICWLLMSKRSITCQLDALKVEDVPTSLSPSLPLSIFGDIKMLGIHLWRCSVPE